MVSKTQKNGNSVISLTMGIISIFVPLFGLFLGICGVVLSRKAVKEIKVTSEDGKGLATLGLICSSVGILIQLNGLLVLFDYQSVSNITLV